MNWPWLREPRWWCCWCGAPRNVEDFGIHRCGRCDSHAIQTTRPWPNERAANNILP